MKKVILVAFLLLLPLLSTAISIVAETSDYYYYGELKYAVLKDEVEIIDCDTDARGVTIPKTLKGYPVTSIGDYAFSSCSRLTRITIPDGIINVGFRAFYGCTELSNITLPESITNIDESAFVGTAYYENKANWENDILYIGKNLIEAKDSITTCIIQPGTKCIAESAFEFCKSLTQITIPDSVTHIGSWAFGTYGSGCGLESVYITNLTSYLNIVFENEFAAPMRYGDKLYLNGKRAKNLTISEQVKQIPVYAFAGCDSLESIKFSNTVESIGHNAFDNCIGLKSVTFGGGVKSIGNNAFVDCERLENIIIPNSVESIGSYAFEFCDSLKSVKIGSDVKSIGTGAFTCCESLRNIIIPESVTSIGSQAFWMCRGLISAEVLGNIESMGERVFLGCNGLQTITFASTIQCIPASSFEGCGVIKTIIMPVTMIEIEAKAFEGCSVQRVEYGGTCEQWEEIYIGIGNDALENATINYNSLLANQMGVTKKTEGSNWIFTVWTTAEQEGDVYIAVYDKMNMLVGIQMVYVRASDMTEIVIPKSGKDAKVKVFLWSKKMTPKTPCKSLSL